MAPARTSANKTRELFILFSSTWSDCACRRDAQRMTPSRGRINVWFGHLDELRLQRDRIHAAKCFDIGKSQCPVHDRATLVESSSRLRLDATAAEILAILGRTKRERSSKLGPRPHDEPSAGSHDCLLGDQD